ncbi:hypothetical protein [Cognatiluteimonas weifangensis]|uniref:Uncharacterized protein n=1 Tax=Cognatiluteimonas weifangensis TaxID=2303539 RepID=A0A372DNC9_9GAMM|nr:hypothetical protein [Luteimonas weifangensis]RFP61068.1 hypothetical protein D0Y53_04830 [Luteimonas weifangensis]
MPGGLLQGEGFKIGVEWHGSYLRAHVFDGVDSLPVSIAMWTQLAELCRQYSAQRLLVLEDLEDTVEIVDIDRIIEAMLQLGFGDIRIAFVELRGDMSGNEHGEILAVERGVAVRVFGNETQARRWLLYGE